MNKNIFKSIGVCILGIAVGVALSLGTDYILESMGVLPHGNFWVGAWLVIFVIFYRTVYNVLGSYIIARLAPSRPMRHVIIVGIIGTLVTTIGAFVNMQMDLGPDWYCWTLVVLALPSAWLGGWLWVRGGKK